MANNKTIYSYYKKKEQAVDATQEAKLIPETNAQEVQQLVEPIAPSNPQVGSAQPICECDVQDLVKGDPALCYQILDCPIDKQYNIRKAYMKLGPYQPKKDVYPSSSPKSHPRRFQSRWFQAFSWLEYSPSKYAAFCFPCFLFCKKPKGKSRSNTFTVEGFRSCKKVNNRREYAFLSYMGKDSNSAHNFAVQCYDNVKSGKYSMEQAMEKVSDEDIIKNRLRLKTSIDDAKWLAFQACPFRGNDKGPNSKNQGNFQEMVKLLASYNEKVNVGVLGNAPGNAKYTSPDIQKEILYIIATNIQISILKKIGDAKFCVLVDEARDETKRE